MNYRKCLQVASAINFISFLAKYLTETPPQCFEPTNCDCLPLTVSSRHAIHDTFQEVSRLCVEGSCLLTKSLSTKHQIFQISCWQNASWVTIHWWWEFCHNKSNEQLRTMSRHPALNMCTFPHPSLNRVFVRDRIKSLESGKTQVRQVNNVPQDKNNTQCNPHCISKTISDHAQTCKLRGKNTNLQ